MENFDLLDRALVYAQQHGLTLGSELGGGVQGIVWTAKSQDEQGRTAIKVHRQEAAYLRERNAYLRLRELGVNAIYGSNVPELLDYDDDLQLLKLTVVTRPFVLDFGGAYLDRPPSFSDEIMADWHSEKAEQFGKRWPAAQAILHYLEGLGIYVIDVNPNNISWLD